MVKKRHIDPDVLFSTIQELFFFILGTAYLTAGAVLFLAEFFELKIVLVSIGLVFLVVALYQKSVKR